MGRGAHRVYYFEKNPSYILTVFVFYACFSHLIQKQMKSDTGILVTSKIWFLSIELRKKK